MTKNQILKIRFAIGIVIIGITTMVFIGCEPETKHKILVFFFDGVPVEGSDQDELFDGTEDPNKPKRGPKIVFYNAHKRADISCATCHPEDERGLKELHPDIPELCHTCHDDYNKKMKYVHGPVSVGFCDACHSRGKEFHQSRYKGVLRAEQNVVCNECHEQELLMTNPTHKEAGEKQCTECHNPHGGPDRYMLRINEEAKPKMEDAQNSGPIQ